MNLSGADLYKTNLSGANLVVANLLEANLTRAYLRRAVLAGAVLTGKDLSGVRLAGANLSKANLSGANLLGAELRGTRLVEANLSKANLQRADLSMAYLLRADLSGSNLSGAKLSQATLISVLLLDADLTGCHVYGISAWDLKLDGAKQKNVIITPRGQPEITVDNLEVAQFIYLLLNNERVRNVINTITSKVVLILGRFTEERKAVLDALREELRQRDYLPVLFDFDKPASRTTEETISTLAHMARFVIADLEHFHFR